MIKFRTSVASNQFKQAIQDIINGSVDLKSKGMSFNMYNIHLLLLFII